MPQRTERWLYLCQVSEGFIVFFSNICRRSGWRKELKLAASIAHGGRSQQTGCRMHRKAAQRGCNIISNMVRVALAKRSSRRRLHLGRKE